MKTIGQKIKERRESRGWTREKLAVEIDGVSAQTIAAWERDQNVPRADALARLAKALGVSADSLLLGIND